MSYKIVVIGVTALAALSLASCAPEPIQPIASESQIPPATSPTPTVSNSTPPTLTSVAMDKTCSTIFPLGKLYEYDPNIALVPAKSGSSDIATEQVKLGGIVCELTNLSSASSTQITIVKLTPESARAKANQIEAASSSGGYQVQTGLKASYQGKTGQFVKNNYWVSVTSEGFSNPVQASPVSYLTAIGL